MKHLSRSVRSGIKLLALYKNVFSLGQILAGSINACFRWPTQAPLTINLLSTHRCNFCCKMCVSDQCTGAEIMPQQDVDFAVIEKLVSDVKRFNPVIHIGGGEPFMRKDMPDIIRMIKGAGLKCLLTTNGSLMGPSIVDALIGADVDIVIVSLYGPENIHDAVVGVPGAFRRTINNLSALIKRKKRTKILVSMIALPESISQLSPFVAYLKSLGVDAVKIEHLNFLTVAEHQESSPFIVDGFDLTPSMHIATQNFQEDFVAGILRLKNDLCHYDIPVYLKPYLEEPQLRDWYLSFPERGGGGCGFITHSLFVNHNGDILPCQFLPRCVLGNVRDDSLLDIWRSDVYRRLRKLLKQTRLRVCGRCCKN